MDTNISITADETYRGKGHDGDDTAEVSAYGFDSAHVSMAGEARCNGDEEAGASRRCTECGLPLRDDEEDQDGRPVAIDGSGDPAICAASPDEGPHLPAWIPGTFANSARVYVDDSDEVGVTISVGDPRGAFVMRVHRNDAGELFLSVPHPTDGMPHMNLTEIRPGFYKIGG